MRDQKAALLPFAMAATEATQVSLQAPSVTHLCMPHVLSATRMLRVLAYSHVLADTAVSDEIQ